MKRILLTLALLLGSFFYLLSQPVLYGVATGNGNGNSVLSKFTAGANTLTAAHTFEDMGAHPNSGLVEGADGKYYGLFSQSGKYGQGVIYSFDPVTSVYTKLKEFNNTSPTNDGAYPRGEMVRGPDDKLYGITNSGGNQGAGVIYCFDPATNTYTKKRNLNYSIDGGYTQAVLFLSADGNFYGTTPNGGANGYGTIFRFDPVSSTYSVLYNLSAIDGYYSQGRLAQFGNKLYGSTVSGGSNSTGTIFSFDLVTNSFQKHLDFDANNISPFTNLKGSYSYGGLTLGNTGKLYGTTYSGGLNNRGTFFSFDPITFVFTKIKDFNYSDGANPFYPLLSSSDGRIYGSTSNGGISGGGIIFTYSPSTTTYQIVKHFDIASGTNPSSLFETLSGKLISTTSSGGTYRAGVIFSFNLSTAVYSKIYEFNSPDGRDAVGAPALASNGKLYGITYQGGNNNYGILYSFDPSTSIFTKLRDFDYATGGNPRSGLLKASDGKLYGMTYMGGSNNVGVIYSYDPVTSMYTKLKDLTHPTGGYPYGNSLIEANNGKLYGMTTQGGVSGYGVIFSFDPNTLVYTKLKDFNYVDGIHPYGSLLQASNGKLYGFTNNGGASGYGVFFSFDPVTLDYTKIKEYDYYTNGGYPNSTPVKGVDNKIHGMITGGFIGGYIFSYDYVSGIYEPLTANGYNPANITMASNGKIYSMGYSGGSYGVGYVFSFNPENISTNQLQSFNYDNGLYPNLGSSFVEVSGCSALPQVTISTNSSITNPICQGSSLTFSASGGTSYYWTGPNGFSSTQQNPTINNASLNAVGSYSVQVSNGEGDCVTTESVEVGINPRPMGTVTADATTVFCEGGSVGLSASFTTNSQCIYSANNNCTFTTNVCSDGYAFFSNSLVSKTLNTPVAIPASLLFKVYWSGYNYYYPTFKFYLNGNLIYTGSGTSSDFNCTSPADGNYPSTFTVPQSAFSAYWNNNGSNTFKVGFLGYSYVAGVTVQMPGPPPVSYQWTPSAGLSNASISNPVASPTITTTYTATATASSGCSANQNITVTVRPKPIVSISPEGPISVCSNGTVLLTANIGAGSGTITSYQWYRNDVAIQNAISSTYSASQTGNYKVKVVNSFNCETTSTPVSVTLNPPVVIGSSVSYNSTGTVTSATLTSPADYTFASGGTGVANSGGRTWFFSNFNDAAYAGLWWTLNPIANPRHSSQNATGNMVFSSYNAATGIATFVSSANMVWSANSGTENIQTRLRMQFQPYSGTHSGPLGSGWITPVTAGSIGLATLSSNWTLADVKALAGTDNFQVWYIIEEVSTGLPLNVYYGTYPHTSVVGGQVVNSVSGNFFSAVNAACNGGTANITISASGGTTPYSGTGIFTVAPGTYTYTVTDAAGCSSSTSITVNQQVDDTDPEITCPSNIGVNAPSNACSASVSFAATVTDNCSATIKYYLNYNTPQSLEISSPRVFPVGTYTVTAIATDPAGNDDNCSFSITVSDITRPTFICPSNQNVNLNATCQLVIPNLISGLTGSDNCGTVTFTQNPVAGASFASSHNQTHNVLITASDANGNTQTCSVVLTGKDVTKPTFTCPDNQDVDLNASCQLIVPNLIAELTGSDNCGTVTFTQSPGTGASIASSHNQTHNVVITASDGNGNTQTCTVVLTGKDVAKPTFTCPVNQNVNLNATCQLVVPNLISGLTGSDNCGTVTFTQSPVAGASLPSSHNQTHNIIITASDGNGNTQTCTVVLTGKDVSKPTFACPGNQNVNLNGTCQLVVPDLITELAGSDNCGTVTFTQAPSAGASLASSHNQTQNVVITANDGNGNTQTCTVVLTAKDVTKPTFTCPGNQNINLNATCQLLVPNLIAELTGSDNCGTVTFTQSPGAGASLASSHNQTHNVVITANDGNGNTQTCTVVLTGKDVTKPTFTCPGSQNVNLNGSCQLVVPNLIGTLIGSDNCGTVNFTQSPVAAASLASSHNQTHNVVVTASDGNGNTQTCTVVLTGKDVTKPTFICPENLNVNLTASCQLIVPNLIGALIGSDNCGTVTFTQSPVAGASIASSHNQTQNVVITANDGNGNTQTCTVVLTAKDVTLPAITCPAPKTVSCDASVLPANTGSATATDNCGGTPIITYADVSGQDPNSSQSAHYNYTITRTWMARDAAGNTNTCNQIITVQDITDPDITCPPDKLNIPFDFGQLYATINIGTATATDNCAAAANITIGGVRSDNVAITNQQYPLGQTTIAWSAVDPSDNSDECTQTIFVRRRNTTVTYTGEMIDNKICVQYSDIINLQAKLTDNEGLVTPNNISGRTITFQLLSGTTVLRSKNATTNASGIAIDSFKIEQAPGMYIVKAIFTGDSYFNGNYDQENCEVKQEDAIVDYNGSQYFTTASSSTLTGSITLAAAINDTDDGNDKRGDIRKAKVTFKDGGASGTVLGSPNLTVGLVNPGIFTNGLAATTQNNITLNNNDASCGGKIFQVWVGASDHYTGADAGPTPVTLALPGQDFVTGGGNLVVTNSAGTYAGTPNSKMNFGFTMKWNKSGKSLQGNINIVFRKWQLFNGVWQWRVYQVKSNAINSMAVVEVGANGLPVSPTNPAVFRKAVINTKANLKDVTDPLNIIDLLGNHNLIMDAYDHITANGGVSDKISVTLMAATTNNLLFSSSWVSNGTTAQTITGGNVNVRNNTSSSSTTKNTATTSVEMESEPIEDKREFSVKVYPNPSEHQFTMIVTSDKVEEIDIQLFDASGRTIQTLSVKGNELIRFGEKLKTGIYFARVIQGNKTETVKLIKQ